MFNCWLAITSKFLFYRFLILISFTLGVSRSKFCDPSSKILQLELDFNRFQYFLSALHLLVAKRVLSTRLYYIGGGGGGFTRSAKTPHLNSICILNKKLIYY